MKKNISRRTVLARAGAAAVGATWARTLVGQSTRPVGSPLGAGERVGVGLIGCGQRGWQLLDLLLRRDDVDIPIVCDVDSERVGLAAQRVEQAGRRKPETVADFLKMLDRSDVHAVVIATPDYWHAVQHFYACAAGKDVYLESPVGHNVIEGAAMVQVTRKFFRVVQVGMQHRSAAWFGDAVQQVRAGKLGKIAQTRSWNFAKVEPVAPSEDGQSPASLDYDRWLGPAAKRAYNAGRSHRLWKNWWEYGGGMVTRGNCHYQDLIHWAMKANAPVSITAVGGNQGLGDFRETPDTLEVIYEYDTQLLPRPGRFVHVYSLRLSNGHAVWAPPVPAHNDTVDSNSSMHSGALFHGEEATLLVDPRGSATFPTALRQEKAIDAPARDDSSPLFDVLTMAHIEDFLNCVRTRGEPRAPIEAGQYAAAACHLANIAYRTGHRLYCKPGAPACFTDPSLKTLDTQATEMLRRVTYRSPYGPPAV
ncbi:MAG: Gfo/Idh/MocA family oxidoreductase [Planctomycetes bacterium]|nr:Gfo/Idh/MocA family oxidoreductase [Planctomycetota bacterium]